MPLPIGCGSVPPRHSATRACARGAFGVGMTQVLVSDPQVQQLALAAASGEMTDKDACGKIRDAVLEAMEHGNHDLLRQGVENLNLAGRASCAAVIRLLPMKPPGHA